MINAIAIDDEPLALSVIESLCKNSEDITLQKTFTHPSEALKYLRKFPTDLVFCDIQMPSISGINLAKSLGQNTMIIFTTAFTEYAVESYELNAVDYLLKPINQKRFMKTINKVKDHFSYIKNQQSPAGKSIFVRADFSLMQIPETDILYIEGLADYLKIYIKDRKTVIARMTMKEMQEKLNAQQFIRIHRSYIVPLNKIESVKGSTIYIDQQEFPIGKTYMEEFNTRYTSR